MGGCGRKLGAKGRRRRRRAGAGAGGGAGGGGGGAAAAAAEEAEDGKRGPFIVARRRLSDTESIPCFQPP